MRRRDTQAGFTFLEIAITIALLGTGFAASFEVLSTSDDLASQGRAHLRASARYREAHAAVAGALRSASVDSLTGFDVDGAATQPQFRRVTGVVDGAVALGEDTELRFRASGSPLPGIGAVGEIVATPAGGPATVLAENVVAGSFSVRQEGRNLVISLKTWYRGESGEVVTNEGDTVVSLRN